MDHEIAKTLGELERKLHELEGALAAIDRSDSSSRRAAPEDGAATAVPEQRAEPPASATRLIDEAIESNRGVRDQGASGERGPGIGG